MSAKRILHLGLAAALLGVFLWALSAINRNIVISSFTTSLSGRNEAQIENLQIAAAKIDGSVIKPGEVFSFNDTVGERLEMFGFQGAPTIYQGQLVNTPGGGLCQLSSTLYNAALLGGMEIIERSPHVWTINSVPPGRDAAVLYSKNASIDLKFRNKYDFPVKISVEVSDSRIVVLFLSTRKLPEQISVRVDAVQLLTAPVYRGRPGVTRSAGRFGCKVRVYRLIHRDGKLVGKELVSVDRYEPVPADGY